MKKRRNYRMPPSMTKQDDDKPKYEVPQEPSYTVDSDVHPEIQVFHYLSDEYHWTWAEYWGNRQTVGIPRSIVRQLVENLHRLSENKDGYLSHFEFSLSRVFARFKGLWIFLSLIISRWLQSGGSNV